MGPRRSMNIPVVLLVVWWRASAAVVQARGRALLPPARTPHRDVTTPQGVVRGYKVNEPPHYKYLGVPYGGPTTDYDRFKPSESRPRWDGVFEATHRVKCPQPDNSGGVESCLVVNVFAPEHPALMPVMVHLHDGGFYSGWGSHDAPPRLILQGILVVTFNYRLGALGFLCLGVPEAPGNAGFKDQVAALYWIQKNIRNFGGDPNDVTLYGTGSGAVAAQFLILSPVASGLFHKAILESGSALSPLSLSYYDPFELAKDVESLLKNTSKSDNVEELLKFYKGIPYKNFANFSKNFRPCVEGPSAHFDSLIENDPMEALRSGKTQNIPIIFVHTDKEVLTMIDSIPEEWNTEPDPNVHEILPNNIEIDDADKESKIIQSIVEMYFKNREDDGEYVKGYIDLYSDIYVVYPVVMSALLHAARSTEPVYLMKFAYEGEINNQKADALPGASHGDVSNYIFSQMKLPYEDEVIADRMINMWSNFIKIGDPTPLLSSLTPLIWQPIPSTATKSGLSLRSTQYLVLRANSQLQRETIPVHMQFWYKLYKNFYKPYSLSEKD